MIAYGTSLAQLFPVVIIWYIVPPRFSVTRQMRGFFDEGGRTVVALLALFVLSSRVLR
jgi:hypothetical protein